MLPSKDSHLLEFYSGKRPDHAGRMLGDIWDFTAEQIDSTHDFIQWLFPLPTPSPINPKAPLLSKTDIDAFRSREELQENLLRSFKMLLDFLGLAQHHEGNLLVIEVGENFFRQRGYWLKSGNHNHRRISRMLRSLTLLGQPDQAKALLDCLSFLRAQSAGAIDRTAFGHWQEAVRP